MEINAKKVDEANIVISATILKNDIEKNVNKIAKEAAKTMDIQGFRKGKVPTHIVKARYGKKLIEDAQNDSLREVLASALKELNVANDDMIGEPSITKFEEQDSKDVEVEVKISIKPSVELGDYKSLIPKIEKKEVLTEDIDSKLEEIAQSSASLSKIKRKRAVKDQDHTIIDFEGFINGVAFEGGKAEKYPLQVGSNSFIPGFEEQIIGMKYEESKDITVTFPESYQSKDLAGKEVIFKVTLHEIQEKNPATLDDEFAKKMLPSQEDATLDTLKDKLKEQLQIEKMHSYYNTELKPLYLDALVKSLKFALPTSVVEQELNLLLNNKVKDMKENEIKVLQEDSKKVDALRDEFKTDAEEAVRATFIVNALAKAESVDVDDKEVSQVIYYEAMQMGKNPQEVLKEYEKAGYLAAIKMSMIEEKVIKKLFDEKLVK